MFKQYYKKAWFERGKMKKTNPDEIRAIKAKRATKFFKMLSDQRQITKELARKERKDKEAAEKRRKEMLADLQRQKEPVYRPPRPSLPSPKPPEPPRPVVTPNPATQAFMKWCFSKDEEEETPPWVERSPRIYKFIK